MKDTHHSAQKLSLISFNALGAPFVTYWTPTSPLLRKYRKQRFEKIAEALQDVSADIICFQEVHTYPLLYVLQRTLKQYPYVAYKKYLYGPRGGLVIFSKLPLGKVDYLTFKKNGSFFDTSIVGKISRKGVLFLKLAELPIYIINTHLTTDTVSDYTKKTKYASYLTSQLEEVKALIKDIAQKPVELIIAGDFNMPKGSKYYNEFISAIQAKDLFADTAEPTYHEEYLPKGRQPQRLDYIFIRNITNLKISATEHIFAEKVKLTSQVETFLSDHIGLKVDLTFLKK